MPAQQEQLGRAPQATGAPAQSLARAHPTVSTYGACRTSNQTLCGTVSGKPSHEVAFPEFEVAMDSKDGKLFVATAKKVKVCAASDLQVNIGYLPWCHCMNWNSSQDGKARVVEVGGDKEIAVFRWKDRFYPLDNNCPHQVREMLL